MINPVKNKIVTLPTVAVSATTPTPLLSGTQFTDPAFKMVCIQIRPSVDIYLGEADVTAATGALYVAANTTYELLHTAGQVFALSTAGTSTVRVQVCGA